MLFIFYNNRIYLRKNGICSFDIQFNFNAHTPYNKEAIPSATALYIIAKSLESVTLISVDTKYNAAPKILDTTITAINFPICIG